MLKTRPYSMVSQCLSLSPFAIRCAKLQSQCHYQQTNTQFLQAGCPSCHPTNSVKTLKGKVYQCFYCLLTCNEQ